MDQPPALPPQLPPQSPGGTPEKPRAKSFKLHPVSIVFLVVGAILAAIQGYQGSALDQMEGGEKLGFYFGTFLAAIGFPLLLGWLVWLLSRRRRWAGNLVFCLLTGIMSLGLLMNLFLAPRLQAKARQMALMQQVNDLRESAPPGEALDTEAMEKLGNVVSGLDSYSESVSDEKEAIAARVGAQFLRELQAKTQVLLDAQGAYLDDEAVSIDATVYTSPEQIGQARELTQAYGQASREMYDYYADLEPHLTQMYETGGLSTREAQKAAQGTVSGIGQQKLALIMLIHRTNAEYAVSLDKFLKLLQDDWGQWGYDEQDDTLWFENDDTLAAYNQLIERLASLEEKMATQQKQLLALQRQE